jgi:predicted transcriptional regulator
MLENDELVDPTPQGAVPADDIANRVADINGGIDQLIERLVKLEAALQSPEVVE